MVCSFSCGPATRCRKFAENVGYRSRHFQQRIVEHKRSAIGKHFLEAHEDFSLLKESHFHILRKCQTNFDCLVYEMLLYLKSNGIRKLHRNLNKGNLSHINRLLLYMPLSENGTKAPKEDEHLLPVSNRYNSKFR